MSPKATKKSLTGTDLIHGDSEVGKSAEVVPSISVTTTFRAPGPWKENEGLDVLNAWNPARHVYSRYTQDVSTRAEKILSKVTQGYALTFASGLNACYTALVHYQPKRIAITGGYFGCHMSIEVYKKTRGADLPIISIDDEFQPGDLCWLETPLNPTGEARDIKYYADKVHAVGGYLAVDSTFGPPPLQYPFKWGADLVHYSGTKYFGGHSDLLCGILVAKTLDQWNELCHLRTYMGSMMGSLEAWLLLRSLRTLHLRVPRQAESATILAEWLNKAAGGKSADGIPAGVIDTVWHTSIQGKDGRGWEPSEQMEGGWSPTFSILPEDDLQMAKTEYARLLPHSLKYFIPATSLGGVESLIDHRIAADASADPRLIRLSVGVEDVEDLKDDLRRAFQEIYKPKAKL